MALNILNDSTVYFGKAKPATTSISDVTDVVGSYAALQDYNTTKLNDNDIIEVLTDESRDDANSYYRWSAATQSFVYVGEKGPFAYPTIIRDWEE